MELEVTGKRKKGRPRKSLEDYVKGSGTIWLEKKDAYNREK